MPNGNIALLSVRMANLIAENTAALIQLVLRHRPTTFVTIEQPKGSRLFKMPSLIALIKQWGFSCILTYLGLFGMDILKATCLYTNWKILAQDNVPFLCWGWWNVMIVESLVMEFGVAMFGYVWLTVGKGMERVLSLSGTWQALHEERPSRWRRSSTKGSKLSTTDWGLKASPFQFITRLDGQWKQARRRSQAAQACQIRQNIHPPFALLCTNSGLKPERQPACEHMSCAQWWVLWSIDHRFKYFHHTEHWTYDGFRMFQNVVSWWLTSDGCNRQRPDASSIQSPIPLLGSCGKQAQHASTKIGVYWSWLIFRDVSGNVGKPFLICVLMIPHVSSFSETSKRRTQAKQLDRPEAHGTVAQEKQPASSAEDPFDVLARVQDAWQGDRET